MRDLCQLSALEAASEIASGSITSHQLVSACLHRIDSRDENVRAWQYVDAEAALEQARIKDQQEPAGPLHGVPVGIKDVIDTKILEDFPILGRWAWFLFQVSLLRNKFFSRIVPQRLQQRTRNLFD